MYKFVVIVLENGTKFIEANNRRHAEELYKGYDLARLEKWDTEKGTVRTLKEKTQEGIESFKFWNCSADVYDCPLFRIVKVYDLQGKEVLDIRTMAKGLTAAKLAISDAKRFRYI